MRLCILHCFLRHMHGWCNFFVLLFVFFFTECILFFAVCLMCPQQKGRTKIFFPKSCFLDFPMNWFFFSLLWIVFRFSPSLSLYSCSSRRENIWFSFPTTWEDMNSEKSFWEKNENFSITIQKWKKNEKMRILESQAAKHNTFPFQPAEGSVAMGMGHDDPFSFW